MTILDECSKCREVMTIMIDDDPHRVDCRAAYQCCPFCEPGLDAVIWTTSKNAWMCLACAGGRMYSPLWNDRGIIEWPGGPPGLLVVDFGEETMKRH